MSFLKDFLEKLKGFFIKEPQHSFESSASFSSMVSIHQPEVQNIQTKSLTVKFIKENNELWPITSKGSEQICLKIARCLDDMINANGWDSGEFAVAIENDLRRAWLYYKPSERHLIIKTNYWLSFDKILKINVLDHIPSSAYEINFPKALTINDHVHRMALEKLLKSLGLNEYNTELARKKEEEKTLQDHLELYMKKL